jgi:hypothetical protein
MELPGCWLGLLSFPADCGRLMLELVMESNEVGLRGDEFGCV